MTVANTLVFIPNITKALLAVKRILKLIDIPKVSVTINESKINMGVSRMQ